MIEELVRGGARRIRAEALQAEAGDYVARFVAERDERRPRVVGRNGTPTHRQGIT